MKKLKHIAAILAVALSILISVDDVLFLSMNIQTVDIPVNSNASDTSSHYHFSLSDHFCQNSDSDTEPVFVSKVQSSLNNQPLADLFLSSIWQPPQKTI